MIDVRRCRYCDRVLVRAEGERGQGWSLRRFCNESCKNKLAHQRFRERHRPPAAVVIAPDFRPHEISPRDGGPLPRIDRPLLRSMTGCSAAW